mgnify:CR=1 FL=1
MKFIIVAPEYSENSGGIIALHKLCHCINLLGGEAYLHPYVTEHQLSLKGLRRWIRERLRLKFSKYKTNPSFITPVVRRVKDISSHEIVVVYPEIVSGNPLGCVNRVRWFLHHPGYHTRCVNYLPGELYFSYGVFGKDFSINDSKKSSLILEVSHLFTEYYNVHSAGSKRDGSAYCIRKGKGRPITHKLDDSVLIDGKSHFEISEIFKKSKYFISYDLYTAYTWFAILCGCVPIVIPDEKLAKNEWYSDPISSLGIAYGYDEVEVAISESEKAIENILKKEEKTLSNVALFLSEVSIFFFGEDYNAKN